MFGLGHWELLLIVVVVLLVFGPKRIPSMMKGVGEGFRELRKAKRELTADAESVKSDLDEVATEVNAATREVAQV